MMYGYARVSTQDQNLEMQLRALKEFGCDEIYSDKISGTTSERPKLSELREILKDGDHLVVWKLDRLFRSTQHAINQMQEWLEEGIQFTCTSQNITTADESATGKLMRTMLIGFAEFERDLISERTRAGMAAAKASGKHVGRRKALGSAQIDDARRKIADGWSIAKTARFFKVSRGTLYNHGISIKTT